MRKYILNAFPNAFLPTVDTKIVLVGISEEFAKKWVDGDCISAIGHESTANLFSRRLQANIPTNRIQLEYDRESEYLIGGFILPRRLKEGELLTEEEILSLPIRWVLLTSS